MAEAATISLLEIPAERHAVITCPAESKRMQVEDGVVADSRDLLEYVDGAIRHHDSSATSVGKTGKEGCTLSG